MTLQDDFAAAIEQLAAGKREQAAAALAAKDAEQAKTDSAADFLRGQFELLDADGQPAEPLPATEPDPNDIFNILPNF
ncbi:hypothetical protein [Pseudarthrobacter sp. NamB4]|uniref:hypothetical protein n=1 Tax=Pseudarthrobacter sp. NamB4 TaxID=2576837 RepID=UPI0010FDAC11|nr:hypothetical protein [Pseudarthrobacter sp. NamB4]TLM75967.1 hypothetical protein FDW81_01035 [Pseudarthrobacter sp. NamB4]